MSYEFLTPERTKPSYFKCKAGVVIRGHGRYSNKPFLLAPSELLCKWCKEWVWTIAMEASDLKAESVDEYQGRVFILL